MAEPWVVEYKQASQDSDNIYLQEKFLTDDLGKFKLYVMKQMWQAIDRRRSQFKQKGQHSFFLPWGELGGELNLPIIMELANKLGFQVSTTWSSARTRAEYTSHVCDAECLIYRGCRMYENVMDMRITVDHECDAFCATSAGCPRYVFFKFPHSFYERHAAQIVPTSSAASSATST